MEIWLYENADLRIEGKIIGFDEYMNTVLDEAEEVNLKKGGARKKIGRIILKGDNISLICNIRYAFKLSLINIVSDQVFKRNKWNVQF